MADIMRVSEDYDDSEYDLISNAKFIQNYKELSKVQSLFTGGNLVTISVLNIFSCSVLYLIRTIMLSIPPHLLNKIFPRPFDANFDIETNFGVLL